MAPKKTTSPAAGKKASPKATAKRAKTAARKTAKVVKAAKRHRAVPEPGSTTPEANADFLAMTKVLMAAVPPRGTIAQDDLYEAARHGTTRKQFPGDTHRMWAKQVLLELQAKGVLVSDGGRPATWRRA